MRIQFTGSADLNNYGLAVNKKRDGKEAFLDLTVGVDQDKAKDEFGETFLKSFFSSMDTDQEGVSWGLETMKPKKKKFICERHVITINGHEIRVHPKLTGVTPVEETPRVLASIRVPVPSDKWKFIKALHENMEAVAEIHIEPENGDVEEEIAKQQEMGLPE